MARSKWDRDLRGACDLGSLTSSALVDALHELGCELGEERRAQVAGGIEDLLSSARRLSSPLAALISVSSTMRMPLARSVSFAHRPDSRSPSWVSRRTM